MPAQICPRRGEKGGYKMDTNEVMTMITTEMKKNGADKEQIAQMEIAIQYLGNANFRERLNNFIFEATYKKTGRNEGRI